jgi:hypothetical protein
MAQDRLRGDAALSPESRFKENTAMTHRLLALTTVPLLLAVGCSSRLPADPSFYPTRGKITLNSSPVRWGRIHFSPADTSGRDCWADIGDDGSYSVRTYVDGDGAAAGHYNVYIEPYSVLIQGKKKGEPTRYPARYTNENKPELSADVKEGDNTINFELSGSGAATGGSREIGGSRD